VTCFKEVETLTDTSYNKRIIAVLIEGGTEVLKSMMNERLDCHWAL
jgi:hypothetical protein